MQNCVEVGVDFILHGHKHARGCSVVAFPEAAGEHAMIIVGAASVQHPLSEACSYNVIRRLASGEWRLAVRAREDRAEGVSPYRNLREEVALLPREQHRRRILQGAALAITVGRLDILGRIDENGDVILRYYAKRVAPRAQNGAIRE